MRMEVRMFMRMNMRIDMRMDVRMFMRMNMRIDMRKDVRMVMRMNMKIDMKMDVRMVMRRDMDMNMDMDMGMYNYQTGKVDKNFGKVCSCRYSTSTSSFRAIFTKGSYFSCTILYK